MSYEERRGRYISLELAEIDCTRTLEDLYTCLSLGYLKGKTDFIEQISVFTSHNLYEFNGSNIRCWMAF